MTELARQASKQLKALLIIALAIAGCVAATGAFANSAGGDHYYLTSDSPYMNAEQSSKNNPDQKDYQDGPVQHGPNGEVSDKQSSYCTTGANWPAQVPPASKQTDPRSFAAIKACNKATGCDNPAIGRNLVSGNVAATAMAVGMQQAIARAQMPESILPLAKEMQNQQNQCNADNSANMERNQAGCAIDYVRTYLENFTSDGGNKWNRLRNELFIPIAILLLLPGAVLAQAKAIVAQGFSIFGPVNPFEGIIRAVVAIFLIPATALVVNYGIDVSNAINHSIRDTYQRVFGSDMYRDAMGAHIRAFPVRQPSENKNYVPRRMPTMKDALGSASTAFSKMEGRSLSIKLEDPVAGLSIVPEDRANEMVPYFVNQQRQGYNGLNAGLATTWTILCAFQMAYLYYLWFVGPVVAALWVWPMKQLRDALPNWVDGVVTLCFWSLFWNTTVLIMACFRGVDDTGTVIMTALNFLSTACVKFAFDFSGLVKAAGAEAAKMAEKAAQGGGKGGGKGGSQGGSSQGQSAGHSSGGSNQPTDPGKALPTSTAQSSFPGSSTSSSDSDSSSSVASMSSQSERNSDRAQPGGASTEAGMARVSTASAWNHPYAAADGGPVSGSPWRASGSSSSYSAGESANFSAALVPPPPGQGATDAVVPGIPAVSGQQVGELTPPLLLDRLELAAASAAGNTWSQDDSSVMYANQALSLSGSTGGLYSAGEGAAYASPSTQQPYTTAEPGSVIAGMSGAFATSTSADGKAWNSNNSPAAEAGRQPALAQGEANRQLLEQAGEGQQGGNPQAPINDQRSLRFMDLAALTAIGANADKLTANGAPIENGNSLPPIRMNGAQLSADGSLPPPLTGQAPMASATLPGQNSQIYDDVSLQAWFSASPPEGSQATLAASSQQASNAPYQPDPRAGVDVTAISFVSADGTTSLSVDPGQATLSQSSSTYQDSVYLTRDTGGRPVEYANAIVTSPADVYAACGLYDNPAPAYQTAAYAASTDAAYQTAQAQADVRAARQSAIALVLGRACSAAPPV